MMRLKLWAGISLVFVLGVLAGSLGAVLYYKNRIERFEEYGYSKKAHILMKRLDETLGLSEVQKTEIEAVLREFHKDLSDIRNEVHPRIEELRRRTFATIKEALDGDQIRKFQELEESLRHRHPAERLRAELDRADPEEMMAEIRDRLQLTDEQASKIRPILESSFQEKRLILEESEREEPRHDHSLRRRLREHHNSVEERLSKVLNAEQLVEFRRWQEEQLRGGHTFQ